MDKLSFETAGMFFDYERDKEGKPIAIKTAQIAVCLRSVAAFSMHYIFETYESSVDGRIFTGKQRAHTGNSVAPFSVTWFYGSIIEMEKTELKAFLEGKTRIVVSYGRKGHEKFSIVREISFGSHLDQSSKMYFPPQWRVTAES